MNYLKPISTTGLRVILLFLFLSSSTPLWAFNLQNYSNLQLKVGITDYKPSTFLDENENPAGINIDILNYIAQKELWDIEYISGSFADLLIMLEKGEIDILLNIALLDIRKEKFLFNEIDVFNSWGEIVVRRDSDIRSIPDMAGKKIGAVKGSTFSEGPQGLHNINEWFQLDMTIQEYDSNNEILEEIKNGELDGGAVSRIGVNQITSDFGLRRSGIVFSPVNVRIGINKYHPNASGIASAIDNHLKQIKDDPTSVYYQSFDKHLDLDTPVVTVIPNWIKWAAVSGLFALLIVFGNAVFLKWQVNKKTSELKAVNRRLKEDIRQRKKSEDALIKSEEHYRDLVNKAGIAISIEDRNGKIIFVNEIIAKLHGYTVEEMLKLSLKDTVHPDDYDMVMENHKKRINGEKLPVYQFRGIKKDGSIIQFEVDSTVLKENGIIIGTRTYLWDISARKQAELEKERLEEQLFQSQKMESIGRLAGGIAHDFNNILAGIMGYAELLKMKHDDIFTEEGEAAEVILEGTERAADLTRQLLGFARGGKYNPETLDIRLEIQATVRVTEKIFEKNIEIEYRFSPETGKIEADKHQLKQVITNIIINARDAMPKGGKLTFTTENVYIDEIYSGMYPEFTSGHYVKASFTDTGIGMTKEVLENIFEPFYSTKGEGKGTGLGLATVYGIVKNHNGNINVYSEPGIGTTFTIYFPLSEKDINDDRDRQEIYTGNASVLVVDDEENVQKMARKMLESIGYSVICCSDGVEAVELYKNRQSEIDVVLLDLVMPRMNGHETFEKLKEINPEVKVLLSSGFSIDQKAAEIIESGAISFIQKPYRVQELSIVLKNVLSGVNGSSDQDPAS